MTPTKVQERLEAEIRRLAAEYPDAEYRRPDPDSPRCLYATGEVRNGPDTPGCIVGQALHRAYPEKGIPEDADRVGVSDLDDLVETYLLEEGGVEDEWLTWLGRVQSRQDDGSTWAEAVAYADSWDSDRF